MTRSPSPAPSESQSDAITLSAVMIAKDAAATIGSSLESARFCDEVIVVVDGSSSDATEAIAWEHADRVDTEPWRGYGPAKQHVVSLARGEWILILDADETITPELTASIRETVRGNPGEAVAFRFKRRTRFLGRWMNHGDWGRDSVLRLFRQGQATMSDDPVHESLDAPGAHPVLNGILLHEGDQTIDTYLDRLNRYTTLAAQALHKRGRRTSCFALACRPLFKFIQAYLLRLGFLDGRQGLILAWYSAVYVFTKYAKLRQLTSNKTIA